MLSAAELFFLAHYVNHLSLYSLVVCTVQAKCWYEGLRAVMEVDLYFVSRFMDTGGQYF